MNHTKGLWRIGVIRGDGSRTITAPGTAYVATLWTSEGWAAETEANAQLIAAAPEMLEALGNMLFIVSGLYDPAQVDVNQLVQEARAVVAKAKFGSPPGEEADS